MRLARVAAAVAAATAAGGSVLVTALPSPAAAGPLPGPQSAIAFEPNRGQAPPGVRFLAHTPDGLLALGPAGMLTVLTLDASSPGPGRDRLPAAPARVVLAQHYLGADPLDYRPGNPLAGHVSYFLGDDPARWQRDLPTYAQVGARLYPGISATWGSTAGSPETTYAIHPGATPVTIRWVEAGATAVATDRAGALVLTGPRVRAGGRDVVLKIEESPPTAWQVVGGARRAVQVGYRVDGGVVGFRVGRYDRGRTLYIDPSVSYASYLGADDTPYGLALDPAGDLVVAGHTGSARFPTTPGAYQGASAGGWDVFVTKTDPRTGALVWSTYLGSPGDDGAFGLALDQRGAVVVTGFAGATGFPTTPGAYQSTVTKAGTGCDAFLTRLSPDGTRLEASTLLGGAVPFPNNDNVRVGVPDDEDLGTAVAVGPGDQMTVAGETSSADFPVTVGAYQPYNHGGQADAFVAQVSADGKSLLASTYLGGLDYDFASGVALAPSGDVYVDGETTSTDFPATSGAFRTVNGGGDSAFVARLSGDLTTLRWASYYGGTHGSNNFQYTVPGNLVVNAAGDPVFDGETNATDLPVTGGAYQSALAGQDDAYVAALSPDGSRLQFASYLGGSSYDGAFSVAEGPAGNLWLAGYTGSTDFPVTADAFQPQYTDGYQGGFVAEMAPDASRLLYATHLGGHTSHDPNTVPAMDSAYAVAAGGDGGIALAGITSTTYFPVTADAGQKSYGGGYLAAWVMTLQAGQPIPALPEAPLAILLAVPAVLLVGRRLRRTPAAANLR